ncbi:MAG: methionyl-tRNA formyltransferase [Lentisphaerota bacterium]
MKTKIYFMGSGDIAVPVIDRLYNSNYFETLGVCTQQDKPAGRNREMTPTPVGIWAEEKGVKVEKIASVNSEDFLQHLKVLNPDILIVVSFGQILKQPLLDLPKSGCINIHASLLPKYRGASPITAAILNGDTQTGVSFMQMERGLDSGPVFKELIYQLKGNEFSHRLELDLGKLSAEHVEEILSEICCGKLKAVKQNESEVSLVGKIKKLDGRIDWASKTAQEIERMTRAYYPWPGAYSFIRTHKSTKIITITLSECIGDVSCIPGRIIKADKGAFEIGARSNTALRVLRLVPEGKKEMSSEEFLRGTRVEANSDCINL